MSTTEITSRQNDRVKQTARLQQRRARESTGTFTVEGKLELNRALDAGLTCLEAWHCPELDQADSALTERLIEAAEASFTVPKAVMEKLSHRENPDALLAVFAKGEQPADEVTLPDNALVVVVDGIEKPGNLGAIIRTAEVAGADALLISGESADLYNPHVIRNARGLLFTLPILALPEAEVAAWVEHHQLTLFATTPAASTPHWKADLRQGCAIVLGSEAEGLSEAWLERAATCIQIPLQGGGDSLNVSVSAAVVLFEAVRQRQGA